MKIHDPTQKVDLHYQPKFNKKHKKSSITAVFYSTSEKNANGILEQDWIEGEESSIPMEPGTTVTLKVRPEKFNFLQSDKSKCSQQNSYYQCQGAEFAEKFEKFRQNCSDACPDGNESIKCSPFPFPNMEIIQCPLDPSTNTKVNCSNCIWTNLNKQLRHSGLKNVKSN